MINLHARSPLIHYSGSPSLLPHQLADRRRVADQVRRPAVRGVEDLVGVDAELGVDRRGEVLRREDPLDGARSPCASVAPTTWPPGVPPPANRTDMALDQWSRPASLLILRRPAELAEGDDQRRVEQAALVEVLDQGGDRLASNAAAASRSVSKSLVWWSQPPS